MDESEDAENPESEAESSKLLRGESSDPRLLERLELERFRFDMSTARRPPSGTVSEAHHTMSCDPRSTMAQQMQNK